MATFRLFLPRFLFSLVTAAMITLTLAYFMQSLIRTENPPLEIVPAAVPMEWVRVIDIPPPPPPPEPTPPPPVERQPITPVQPSNDTNVGYTEYATLRPELRPQPMGPRTGHADGELMPIVAVAPAYPERAKARGIEGYVTLTFSVNERGRVENARVVDAVPAGIFDRSALLAITRFRYRPLVVNGEALTVHDVMTRLRFALN